MAKGKTTSMRFPVELSKRLEQTAKRQHRGKNDIVTEALTRYLDREDQSRLDTQLQKESQLIAAVNQVDGEWVEETWDTEGWEWESDE